MTARAHTELFPIGLKAFEALEVMRDGPKSHDRFNASTTFYFDPVHFI